MKKLALLLFATVLSLQSCKEDDSISDTSTENLDIITTDVTLTSSENFNEILTDADGNTLYFFSKDVAGLSVCNDGCLAAWPLFYKEDLTVGEGLDTADFNTITRDDGAKQTTYKGWPLYYFANDTNAGDINGDGVGNNWYVAKADYSLMYAQASLDDSDDLTLYMTNATGRTIYLFANDEANTNNYTQADLSNNSTWPMVTLDIDELPSILDKNDFGTIDVFGNQQVTYKGWPLYYFGGDVNSGDANGVSDVWPIVNTDTVTATETATSTQSTTTLETSDNEYNY